MGAPRFNNALKISMKQSTIVQKYPGHLMSYHTAINLCLCLATYLQHLRQSLPPPIPCPLPIHLRRNPGGGGGAIGTIWPCYSLPLFASLLPQIKTIWRWGIASRRRRRQTDQPSVAGRSVGRTRVIRRGTHTTESHRRTRLRKTAIFFHCRYRCWARGRGQGACSDWFHKME